MRQKRFSIITTDSWANYHFINTEYETEDRKCYYTSNRWTLCQQLNTNSEEYRNKLKFAQDCLSEKELLQYSIDLSNKKIICAKCIGYFFSDEQY